MNYTAQKCWLPQGEVGQLGETLIMSKSVNSGEAPITYILLYFSLCLMSFLPFPVIDPFLRH